MVDIENYRRIISELEPYHARLVAVSKLKPASEIQVLINQGQHAFGENYVQELLAKRKSIEQAEWHFIGHLQSNKVKSIISFIELIHGIDSLNLLKEVDKQAKKTNRIVSCLLQLHISDEETKFGFSYHEARELLHTGELESLKNVSVEGLMGMASLTDDQSVIRKEFHELKRFYDQHRSFGLRILSMGMTSDYKIALEEGSNLVRIGSAIFGERAGT